MRIAFLRIVLVTLAVVLAASLPPPEPASAIVHIAEIHEVMAGFNGDPDVQFVEINQRLGVQNITLGSKLSTFDASGTFIDADPGTEGDQPLLIVPANVPNDGDGVRWLMGTTAFETASGMQADFEFPANPGLPTGAGMVCLFESFRDFTNPAMSVDCVAYGGAGFTGENPNSFPTEAATVGPGDGVKSLTRIVPATFGGAPPWAHSDDANDFALRCPTPENNAGQVALLGADDDADGLPNCHEEELGTNPSVVDSDQDGCADGEELEQNLRTGGGRDPTNFWDFYDTPDPDLAGGPSDYQRDRSIAISDIFRVAGRFGATGTATTVDDALAAAPTTGYHAGYDRSDVEGKLSGPADGAINIGDIFSVAGQFGHSCVSPP